MVLRGLKELNGGETLGKDIITEDFQILLAKGTVLKKEYIEKLREIGYTQVYIRDTEFSPEEIGILKDNIEIGIKKQVKEILEHHTYQHNEELMVLSKTADNIIVNILKEEKVIEKVYDIRERSADLYEHSLSICTLAILTALKLGVSKEKIHDIGVGCLLHDIGLRYLSFQFTNQNLLEMEEPDIAEYKKHPVYGYTVLKREKWMQEISKNIILYHHERLDSSGYPLKASEIPFECQIVNVCDAFDEMICGIGCERTKVYEAVEYLKNFKNVKFNGTIVDAFLQFTAVYPAGSRVLTNEGEEGIVLYQNKEFPDRPVIKIIKNKKGKRLQQPVIKDLVQVNHIFIEKQID